MGQGLLLLPRLAFLLILLQRWLLTFGLGSLLHLLSIGLSIILWLLLLGLLLLLLRFDLFSFLAQLLAIRLHIGFQGLELSFHVLVVRRRSLTVQCRQAAVVFIRFEKLVSIGFKGQEVQLLLSGPTFVNYDRDVPIAKVVLRVKDIAYAQLLHCDHCLEHALGVLSHIFLKLGPLVNHWVRLLCLQLSLFVGLQYLDWQLVLFELLYNQVDLLHEVGVRLLVLSGRASANVLRS